MTLRTATSPFFLLMRRSTFCGYRPCAKPTRSSCASANVFWYDEIAHSTAAQIVLAVAGDGMRAGVREEQMPLGVDDDDAVGRALEEIGVALEGAQAALGLEARHRHLLRLIAQRLHDARVPQRDGHRVRYRLTKRELAIAERESVPCAQEEDAHGPALVEDRKNRERAEGALVALVPHDLQQRVRGHVGDDERLAAREHLLDLRILREVDGQIAQLLVVASGDDVARRLPLRARGRCSPDRPSQPRRCAARR